MLEKLKAKVINSQNKFLATSTSMSTNMNKSLQDSLQNVMKMPDGKEKTVSMLVLNMFNSWNQNFLLLNNTTSALISDMNIYIETLEKYSTELDDTLTTIFESARKIAEEQQKQQDKIRKKEPTYRT